MAINYAKLFNRRATPQSQPIPGSNQVRNSAGGYAWQVDDWVRLDRFLILGAEGGTYYITERDLVKQNHDAMLRCIKADGVRVVNRVAEISDAGRAPKNDPAILFDVWNEPAPGETKMPVPGSNPPIRAPISEDTFMADMRDRVSAVSNVTTSHLSIVYVRALNDIINNHYPIFSQPNIMYDNHIYHSNYDNNQLLSLINYAHSHSQAFVIGEWGGAPGQPAPSTFLPILRANNTNDTYFAGGDLYDGSKKNPTTLNAIGQAVDAQYQITLGQ